MFLFWSRRLACHSQWTVVCCVAGTRGVQDGRCRLVPSAILTHARTPPAFACSLTTSKPAGQFEDLKCGTGCRARKHVAPLPGPFPIASRSPSTRAPIEGLPQAPECHGFTRSWLSLFDANVFRTKTFVTLRGIERDRLPFPRLLEHLATNRAPMDEVLLTVIARDESKSLVTHQPRSL